MRFNEISLDNDIREEFLDRFEDLSQYVPTGRAGRGGFEGLDVLPAAGSPATVDDAAQLMAEGTFVPGDTGIEAIVERFTRPVFLVQDSVITEPGDAFENSEQVQERVDRARPHVEAAIPSVGRIDLRHAILPWAGTGWVVGADVVVTNRHVARVFAKEVDDGFAFLANHGAPDVRASVDWRHEFQRSSESLFRVREVLWIEPDGSLDVALLRIDDRGLDDEPQPAALSLSSSPVERGTWIGVVGYPARSPFNDAADQQRIFDGIYGVKRFAPGKVIATPPNGVIEHDATTLGGNSGSAVIDLETGNVVALHFAGIEGRSNSAVEAGRVAEILDQRT